MDHLLFDFALSHVLAQKASPHLVQVGANSGDTSHDMQGHLARFDVAALLVEPQPDVFKKLTANYSNLPAVKLANVALSQANGSQQLYKISSYANQFHKSGGVFGDSIASFDRQHPWRYYLKNATVKGQSEPEDRILESVTVQCQTFQTLMVEHGLPHVDVLAIDTEGFDFEIIKMADAAGISPQLIKYEHKHLPGGLIGARESWQFLADRGYRMVVVKSTGDTVAWKS